MIWSHLSVYLFFIHIYFILYLRHVVANKKNCCVKKNKIKNQINDTANCEGERLRSTQFCPDPESLLICETPKNHDILMTAKKKI